MKGDKIAAPHYAPGANAVAHQAAEACKVLPSLTRSGSMSRNIFVIRSLGLLHRINLNLYRNVVAITVGATSCDH